MSKGRLVSWLSFLALFALGACRSGSPADEQAEPVRIEGSRAAAPRRDEIRSLPQVSLDALSEAERGTWVALVNDLTSPCGEPVSVARCVAEERGCRTCVPAARYLARLVAMGFDRSEIRAMFHARFDRNAVAEIQIGDSPVRGAPMAPITVVEFSDFECPYCARAYPYLERLVHEHGDEVRVVFKHYPLDGHAHARAAARAAVAAQRQGKFWEMHDLLFENQQHLEGPDLERYAEQLGLDMERFRADLASVEVDARVVADRVQGTRLEIEGTPSIFVNGRAFLEPIENLSLYVREELEQ